MSTESFPKTIKAIGVKKNGDLDAIEELQIPFPAIGPGMSQTATCCAMRSPHQ